MKTTAPPLKKSKRSVFDSPECDCRRILEEQDYSVSRSKIKEK